MNWDANIHDADISGPATTVAQPSRSLFTDFGGGKERGAFSFFLTRTNTQLSGFYNCEFWNKAVLQAAHRDHGIRHALNAVATFHRSFEEGGKAADVDYVFALREYQLAIRSRIDSNDYRESVGLAVGNSIACSLVFICIEAIQGHYESAMSLITGATKLFNDSLEALRTECPWPLNAIERLLQHLHTQIIGLCGHSQKLDIGSLNVTLPSLNDKQGGFESINEMRRYFDTAYHVQTSWEPTDHYAALRDGASMHRARISRIENFMLQWSEASHAMINKSSKDAWTRRDEQALAILQMRRLAWSFDADFAKKHTGDDADQMLWDAYLPVYKNIIALAEKVAALNEKSSGADKNRYFTLDFGMISPLYNVARLCRDPVLRRNAISLLRTRPMREGLWDSLLAARVAESQMEFEEAAVPSVREASDIPLAARVLSASPSFQSEQAYVSVSYSKGRVNRTPESYSEKISW